MVDQEGAEFWWGVVVGTILALLVSQAVQLAITRFSGNAPGTGAPKINSDSTVAQNDDQGDSNVEEEQVLTLQRVSSKAELLDEFSSDESETADLLDEADDGETSASSSEARSTDSDQSLPANAPHFPYLRVNNLLKNSTPQRVFPNSRVFQNFTTPCSRGRALIALKIKGEEDPHFEPLFAGKMRRFELQFQITFKEEPRGVVYVGGEIPDKMQLGLVTKGLCKAILGILNRLSSTIHAGFGKKMSSYTERELPHIAFPLWSAATRMVVTRAGDTPPALGEEIKETPEHHKARIKQATNKPGDLRKGDTVTFSVSSMYLDIVRWRTCNLGALNDIDLSMFWDTMPLQLVMYDLPGYQQKQHKEHTASNKRHYFAFAIENTVYLREPGQPLVIYPEANGKFSDDQVVGSGARRLSVGMDEALEISDSQSLDSSDGNPARAKNPSGEDGLESLAEESLGDGDHAAGRVGVEVRTLSALPASVPVSNLRVVAWIQHAGLRKRGLSTSFVLAYRNGQEEAFSAAFVQPRESFVSNPQVRAALDLSSAEGLSRTPKKVWEWEQMRSLLDEAFAGAASEGEMREAAAAAAPLPNGWLDTHRQLPCARRREDLNVTLPNKLLEWGRVVFECAVIRCAWETKWNEEWAVVLEQSRCAKPDSVVLFFQPGSKTPSLSIRLADVLAANELDPAAAAASEKSDPMTCAFSGCFSALELEKKERVVMLGFASKRARKGLADSVRRKMGEHPSGDNMMVTSGLTSLTLAYEANRWGAQKRQVINSRRVTFVPRSARHSSFLAMARSHSSLPSLADPLSDLSPLSCGPMSQSPETSPHASPRSPMSTLSSSSKKVASCFRRTTSPGATRDPSLEVNDIISLRVALEKGLKPWQVAADLLSAALRVRENSSDEEQIKFFDAACMLRELQIGAWSCVMTEEEKLCFGLNLYHALRLHAKLLVGQPSSILGWATFGSRISYAVGCGADAMVLSLAEIEHCILRKPMTLARTIVSTTYPTTRYTKMLELSNAEPRLNFCLNYGTKSCATKIGVFGSPDTIDKMLDFAAATFLQEMLRIDIIRGTISMPKICYWYGRDFWISRAESGSKIASAKDLTVQALGREIVRYVGRAQDEQIRKLDNINGIEIVFKVRSFRWKALDHQTALVVAE